MKVYRFMTGPIQVNTYVAFDENKQGFIVDPGGYDSRIDELIDKEGIYLNYIILTHGHSDHIGGVAGLKEKYPNIKVIAYKSEQDILNDGELNSSKELFGYVISMDADMYVSDGDELSVGDIELKFIHTPGHTIGGMCIYTDGYMFTGDTIFKESIGRTDFYSGDFDAIIRSIKEKIFVYPDDTVLLPGHMGESTIEHEKQYNPFV